MAEVQQKPKATQVDEGARVQGECPVDGGQLAVGQQAQGRQALGAWWRAYKAEKEGEHDACAAVEQPLEEPGQWLNEQNATAHSFSDLIDAMRWAVHDWFDRAKDSEPPPAWKSVLEGVVSIAASSTLAGVAGQVTATLIDALDEAEQLIVGVVIRSGVTAIQDSLTRTVKWAVDDTDGDPHQALRAFCRAHAQSMAQAGAAARDSFGLDESGTSTKQRFSIAEMRAIRASNEKAANAAIAIQNREMLIGWSSLISNAHQNEEASDDIEGIDRAGVLRIEIAGEADRATDIVTARLDGLNPHLRKTLSGRPFGDIRPGRVVDVKSTIGAESHGIEVVMTTAPGRFSASRQSWERMSRNGFTRLGTNQPFEVRFSVHLGGSGEVLGVDDDMNWQVDALSGADAGRWFVQHIRHPLQLASDLNNSPLPEVQT